MSLKTIPGIDDDEMAPQSQVPLQEHGNSRCLSGILGLVVT